MLTRKCDICGAEMRMTTPRYKVTFDGWLYKSEKDICVPCFERIKAEIQTADTPQTDCDTCRHYKLACELFSEVCKYEPITQTETQNSNNDAPQTDLSAEEFVEGMKNLKMEVKRTDCSWK